MYVRFYNSFKFPNYISIFYKSNWTLFPFVKGTDASDDMELEALSARMAETERVLQKILGHLERRDEVYLLGGGELAGDLLYLSQLRTMHLFRKKHFLNCVKY